MKTVVIVQARMTSSRLPGKVMLPLGSMSVLGHVLSRCWLIDGIDDVCCAIPEGSEHDILEIESKKYKASVYRGSEYDVLERYYLAAKFMNASVIMRITSDCPLIDTSVCGEVLKLHRSSSAKYSCNNLPPTWPHGYDCEVFNFQSLSDCYNNAKEPDEREHVTPWMRKNLTTANYANPLGNQHSIRITLDTPEDYNYIKEFMQAL